MSDLHVRRMLATVHGSSEQGSRVQTLLRRVAEHRLEPRLDAASLPPGEWCVRRVDVRLPWADDTDGALEGAWADAILTSLRAVLTDAGPDVVGYPDLHHALVDAAVSLAAGDSRRAWAWRQVGLLREDDPDPDVDPGGALVAVCTALPRAAVAGVVAAVGATDRATVQRVLGTTGLKRIAALVATAHGIDLPPSARGSGAPQHSRRGVSTWAGVSAPDGPRRRAATARARRICSCELAAGATAPDTQGGPATAGAWAFLVVAAADPAALTLPEADDVVAAVAQLLVAPTPVSPDGGPWPHSETSRSATPARHVPASASPTPPLPHHDDRAVVPLAAPDVGGAGDPVGPDESALEGLETEWGGLLFLLNAATDAAVPDRLADARLAARPASWTLWRVARRLVPAAAADPAVLALAGLDPAGPAPADDEPTREEVEAVDSFARAWAETTARRLAAARGRLGNVDQPVEPGAAVAAVALRPAVVVGEPGWVEARFSLDDVDVTVRKAGLDVDPGWIPWLGRVVRFRYG